MNDQTWLWFVCLLTGSFVAPVNGDTNDVFGVFPLDKGLLVYSKEPEKMPKKRFLVRHSRGFRTYEGKFTAYFIKGYNRRTLRQICVQDKNGPLRAVLNCIDRVQLLKSLSVNKVPVNITFHLEGKQLVSSWQTPENPMKQFTAFWISGEQVPFHQVVNHTQTSSVLRKFSLCENYTFALFGLRTDGNWVQIGQETYKSKDKYQLLTNLQAYPYKASRTIITWDEPLTCSSTRFWLVITTNRKQYSKTLNLINRMDVQNWYQVNKKFNVTAWFLDYRDPRVITMISRTFLDSPDNKLQFTSDSFNNDNLIVSWLQNTTNITSRLIVWKVNGEITTQHVLPNITSIEYAITDACTPYELSVLDCYDSNKCASAGEITLTAHRQNLRNLDVFPLGKDLLLHWKPTIECRQDEQEVEVAVGGKKFTASWKYYQQDTYIPGAGVSGNVTIKVRSQQDDSPSGINVMKYKFDDNPHLFKVKSIKYEENRIIVEPESFRMVHSELSIIWITGTEHVYTEKRSSEDHDFIFLYRNPCLNYKLGIVQSIGDERRIYLGGTTTHAGQPNIVRVAINNSTALIQYNITAVCKPDYLNASIQHTSEVEPVVNFTSPTAVELTNLKPCIQYNFQLIAVYLPKHSTVSEETYITLPPARDENKPILSIKRDQLVVSLNPRASCQLRNTTTTIFKDGSLWRSVDMKSNASTVTLPIPKIYAMYSAQIQFTYANDFVELSEINSIYHEPVSGPQSPLVISTQVNPHDVQIQWKSTEQPAALYYRIDGMYNTQQTFSMIVAKQTCTVPLQNSTEYLNVIVYEMSAAGGGMGRSVHHTIWPQKVPQKPFPPVIERGTKGIVVSWTLVEADPVEKIHITIKLGQHEIVEPVVSPTQHGKHTVQNADCLNAVCTFSLRAVNEYGEGPASDSVAFM